MFYKCGHVFLFCLIISWMCSVMSQSSFDKSMYWCRVEPATQSVVTEQPLHWFWKERSKTNWEVYFERSQRRTAAVGMTGIIVPELVSPHKPQPVLLTEALGLKETKVFIEANSGQSADWGAWLLLISCWRLVNSGEGTRTDFANLKDAVRRSCAHLSQQGSELPDSVRHTILVWNRILSSLLYIRQKESSIIWLVVKHCELRKSGEKWMAGKWHKIIYLIISQNSEMRN